LSGVAIRSPVFEQVSAPVKIMVFQTPREDIQIAGEGILFLKNRIIQVISVDDLIKAD
jgi:hypothetical protein